MSFKTKGEMPVNASSATFSAEKPIESSRLFFVSRLGNKSTESISFPFAGNLSLSDLPAFASIVKVWIRVVGFRHVSSDIWPVLDDRSSEPSIWRLSIAQVAPNRADPEHSVLLLALLIAVRFALEPCVWFDSP